MFRFRRNETRAQRLRRRGRELRKGTPEQLKAAEQQLYSAPQQLRKAAAELDIPWARSWLARTWRDAFLRFVLGPTMSYYTRRRATGGEKLARIRGPVILVANHISHMDTPVILAALPRRLRRRTVVAAAADYFYRNRLVAMVVSLIFNTVPMDRTGGGLDKRAAGHVDGLLDRGWNLLLYPEGTRSRGGATGRVRRGAAVLASRHHLPIVPIRVTGTGQAMPPGHRWPSRIHGHLVSKRHIVNISFGDPIETTDDVAEAIRRVQQFFESNGAQKSNGGRKPVGVRKSNGARK